MNDKKRRKTKVTTISTPLGKIKVPVEIAEEPISEQIDELMNDSDGENE